MIQWFHELLTLNSLRTCLEKVAIKLGLHDTNPLFSSEAD
jgi:hypothetical protein